MEELWTFLFASLSGCCSSLAALSVSYPVHLNEGEPLTGWHHWLSLLANLSLTGAQVGLGFAATSFGAVAVVMPLSVGAALFSNMILQQALKLANFTNESITGTLVLVTAILMLPELGPKPPQEPVDPIVLLQEPQAVVFISVSFVVCFGSIMLLFLQKVTHDFGMLVLFSLVGGSGAVMNMSITKMLVSKPPPLIFAILLAVYIMLAILCLGSGAVANGTLKDASLFVPINNSINLVLNCLAGLLIWRDLDNLEYPWCYFMVYALVGLGSYLVSTIDVFSVFRLYVKEQQVADMPVLKKMVTTKNRSEKGVAFLNLHPSCPHFHAGKELLKCVERGDFESRMRSELRRRMLSDRDVVRLVADLLENAGGIEENVVLKYWVDDLSQSSKRTRLMSAPDFGGSRRFYTESSALTNQVAESILPTPRSDVKDLTDGAAT
mmetsp:Transcript_43412/g.86102  ORF Transcript_43412/g.86102 Transcript_43412/m.86102 type:complete len:437 (-) Transcript_43412:156-1466(-)|eukprot:CAMPEP_0172668280 /NCGR_PEP_ID=MMETSP1074-20121228/8964_1 /TAXON_ID=2916 /ORGANISM="Ceratium fusus, Strain PA161109" /LENGTH=436 /DNA_ID=CAMNT_0013484915 /DNA_START=76 /DNA_END=1386 /DNA_ORIENTATION=+